MEKERKEEKKHLLTFTSLAVLRPGSGPAIDNHMSGMNVKEKEFRGGEKSGFVRLYDRLFELILPALILSELI